MRVVVVALGKVGLPIAVHAASAGHHVIGCDVDAGVCALVNRGEPPFPGEPGLAERLPGLVADGSLRAQADTTAAVAEGADLVIVVPPLVLDGRRPDWRALDGAVGAVGAGLQPGTVVSVETTVPIGTTRTRFGPALAERSGLEPERDFWLVFSPERVFSGRVLRDLDTYPKLVGGLSPDGEARGCDRYAEFIRPEVRGMGSAEAAEMTKLAEAAYRDVNIALANEFARIADAHGLDLAAVIEAANSQPFSHIHRPGIAVGGHCIPVYPRLLTGPDSEGTLVDHAREVNDAMPAYAAERLEAELGTLADATVILLGVAYRGNVREAAYSGAFAARAALEARGATVLATDPLYDDDGLAALGFVPWRGEAAQAAVLQADHDAYAALQPGDLPGVRVILDGRDVLEPGRFAPAGVTVVKLGR